MSSMYRKFRTELQESGPRSTLLGAFQRYNPYRLIYGKLCYQIYRENVVDYDDLKNRYWTMELPAETTFTIEWGSSETLPEYFKRFLREYNPEPRWVCRIPNVTILGDNAMLFTQEGEPISPVTKSSEKYDRENFYQITGGKFPWFKVLRGKPIGDKIDTRTRKSAFPLIGHWSESYYHWFVEYLPRIREFEHIASELNQYPSLLLPNDPPEWLVSSLQLTGVDTNNTVEWNKDIEIAEELFLSSRRVKTGGYYDIYDISADDCRWVKERITSNLDTPDTTQHPSRIYISRQGTTSRKITNFEQIESTLREFGFEIYQLEELSFERQVQILSTAEWIVGPHGSGLVNMLFAPKGARVVELLPEAKNNAHYFRLSQILGHEYHHLPCETNGKNMYLEVGILNDKLSSFELL